MFFVAKKGDYLRLMYGHTLHNDHFLCLFVDFICSYNKLPPGTLYVLQIQNLHTNKSLDAKSPPNYCSNLPKCGQT